jgi:hypothetical protein
VLFRDKWRHEQNQKIGIPDVSDGSAPDTDTQEVNPLAFSPRQVQQATRLWNTASDKERAEAFSLVRSKKGQVRRSPLHRNKLAVVVRVSSYDGDPEELYFDNV